MTAWRGSGPRACACIEREDDPTQPFSPNYGSVPIPQAEDGAEDPAAPV